VAFQRRTISTASDVQADAGEPGGDVRPAVKRLVMKLSINFKIELEPMGLTKTSHAPPKFGEDRGQYQ
jgi:hypothetical protein